MFRENVHNVRNFQVISNKNIKTVGYGLEVICHRTPFLWASLDTIPATSLSAVKRNIKSWEYNACVFRLCQTFQQGIGFL